MSKDTSTITKEQVADMAVEGLTSGLNCGECVYDAFGRAGLLDVPSKTRAACVAFGGGIGLTGNTCGALFSAILTNSMVYGRADPWQAPDMDARRAQIETLCRRYNNMVHSFQKENGYLTCKELCQSVGGWASEKRPENCQQVVRRAAIMAYEFLMMAPEDAAQLPYGENMGGMK